MTYATIGTATDILAWMKDYIANLTGTTPDRIPEHATVDDLGIDSAQSVNMLAEMEEWLQLPNEISPEMLFEGGTVADIADQVATVVHIARVQS
ncbi:acyl carrier protein [uncultured Sphingomonas sp.]|uniref:acyl carrier protein n=1 Tax=uncultured Sphingomonas sp. TaxID=158754 RepID=UPI0035C99EE0